MTDCIEDPHGYWRGRPEEDAGLTREFWVDPHREFSGMLSANGIRRYHESCKLLIDPWNDDQLGAASYELRVGPIYARGDKAGVATREDPWIEIPPNSLVYVSMCERLRLPFYLAASFDLHIDLIYRGLLLGTGPQVDPGFCGVLSCPVHNITNESVRLRLGEPFVKLEFLKVSPIFTAEEEEQAKQYDTIDEFRDWAKPRLPMIDPAKLWREPVHGYLKDRRISSSVNALDESVKRMETTLGRYRLGGAVGLIAFVAILVSLTTLNFTFVDNRVDTLATKKAVAAEEARTAELRRTITDLRQELARLRQSSKSP